MMRTRLTALAIVLGGAVIALLFGPRGPLGGFWRPVTMDRPPAGWQLAGLMGAGLVEAVGFGLALAVLALGRSTAHRLIAAPVRATAAQLATAWLLGSWWPHSALHQHVGLRPSALAGLELGFHGGSILATAVLLWAVLSGGLAGRAATG